MKVIPRFFHGVLDYIMGIFLIVAPNLLGFSDTGGAASWLARIAGVIVLLQAMCTAYEVGVIKMIPISMHLAADYVIGVLLAVSPWLFGFANRSSTAMITMLVAGIFVLATTAMTEPRGRPRHVTA
jgi:hypothetical protein